MGHLSYTKQTQPYGNINDSHFTQKILALTQRPGTFTSSRIKKENSFYYKSRRDRTVSL